MVTVKIRIKQNIPTSSIIISYIPAFLPCAVSREEKRQQHITNAMNNATP